MQLPALEPQQSHAWRPSSRRYCASGSRDWSVTSCAFAWDPLTSRICAVPAATEAGSGCFSHFDASKLSCGGSGMVGICLLKSVGGGGSSRSRRLDGPAAPAWGGGCGGGAESKPSKSAGSAGGAGVGAGCLSAASCQPLGASEALAAGCSVSFSSSSSVSCFRRCSSCARRLALSLSTRFTVVGMRTPSSGAFSCSSPPPTSQSSAACVLFWCFRSACRAGPSSKPCDSSDDSESGSTGSAGASPAQESTPSPALLLLSLASFSMRRTEKSVTTSLPSSSFSSASCSSISTCASRCSGVISTMGRNSMRAGRTPEMA
mmetsp:Transcript_61448/g.179629  ORF Transcript_61448/g.179629 Transcript_61448/m.179629 type:complete len:318 (-) Transcript_61448:731-1684(-)